MKKIIGCLLALAFISICEAQTTKYIVSFKNKANSPFTISNPSSYLSQRAINRRASYNIAIDSSDLPITPAYIDSVLLSGPVIILNRSKWFNSVSITITDPSAVTSTLNKIGNISIVKSVTGIALKSLPVTEPKNKFEAEENIMSGPQSKEMNILTDVFNYGQSYNQVHMHNGEFLHNIGLRGEGMIVGILDAGFNGYLTLKSFDSVRVNGQILGVYDFVAKDSSVNEDHSHGMQCFSTIAANIPSQFVGTSPKANFYLFRTEDASSEYPIEEFNWVCGAERLDSVGGDLLSSSVGYNIFNSPFSSFNHTYAQMNGNTATITIGADLAAKKGILVVNSAGNEGGNSWNFIVAPADGDSVMTVGAVNSAGIAAGFSSRGPTSDGRVKPDIASQGVSTTVQLTNNTIGTNNGTSFAAPNFAGLANCLWQGFREYNNMTIIDAIRRSGNVANHPNDSLGYGVPDVKKATLILLKRFATSSATANNCKATVSWTSKDMNTMRYEIERKNPGTGNFVKVGQVPGTGTSFATHSYQFEDPLGGVNAGTISYRIRQVVDISAEGFAADYIDTTTVSTSIDCEPLNAENGVSLAPNPANDRTNIRIYTTYPVNNLSIRVFNSKGQLVDSYETTKGIGTETFELFTGKFASGKYYVSVFEGDKLKATKELVKL